MRTTLDIADDVLAAARDLARAEGKSMGDVISDLARQALTGQSTLGQFTPGQFTPGQAYGAGLAEPQAAFLADDWLVFPQRSGLPVSSDLVRQIQDDLDLEDAEAFDHERQQTRVVSPSEKTRRGPKA
jgi:hypothetical protein